MEQVPRSHQLKPCTKRRELAECFAIAARLYSEAVVALTRDLTLISRDEYDMLLLAKEEARYRSEAARIAFNEHIDSHHCIRENDLFPDKDSWNSRNDFHANSNGKADTA